MNAEKLPECYLHKIPMVKGTTKSGIFGNMIPVWKCPKCEYTEYRNED